MCRSAERLTEHGRRIDPLLWQFNDPKNDPSECVKGLAMCPDGTMLAAASFDGHLYGYSSPPAA